MATLRSPYPNAHFVGDKFVDGDGTVDVSDEDAESLRKQGWLDANDESQVAVAPKGRKADAPEVPDVTSAEPEPAESGNSEEN